MPTKLTTLILGLVVLLLLPMPYLTDVKAVVDNCSVVQKDRTMSANQTKNLGFDITNLSSSSIVWVRISAPSGFEIKGASTSGFSASFSSSSATFSSGSLAPTSNQNFSVTVTSGNSAQSAASFGVEASDSDSGSSPASCSGNTSVEITSQGSLPTFTSISASSITQSSATISWTTSAPTTGRLTVTLDGATVQNPSDNTMQSSHTFNLIGLASGTVYHYVVSGSDSSNNTISSNLAYNNSNGVGILLHNMSNANNVSYNTVYRNLDGISLNINVSGSNISSNLAYNNTQYGLVLSQEAQNNSAYNNTVYNNTQHGVFLHTASHNNSFISNTVYDNPNNFVFSAVDNSTLTSNYAYNSSGYGFYFAISTGNNLSSNNATNNSIQYGFIDYSNITFTGINRALQTPSTGLDLNITNYSNVTTLVGSTYSNFTTSYGTIFFDNAINVTVKLMNLSDSGASSTGCGSVFTGTCTLLTLSNNIVNISNASATGTIILGMFYNTSTSPTSSNVYIGKYVTANSGWNQVGQTAVDTANGTVRYGAITSFSTFGIVNFVAAPPPPPSDDTVVKSLEIDYDFTCSDGSLEVSTTSGAEVSLVELSPAYIQLEKKEADSDGKALFTITEDGTYKIRATKSGYRSEDKDNLEFSLCEEGTPEDEEEPEPEPQPDQPGEQLECNVDSDCEEGYECTDNNCVLKSTPEPPTPDDSQTEALEEINKAQNTLNEAKKQGKDVTDAQKKLDEAKESYEEGDYEKVKNLVKEVDNLIKRPENGKNGKSTVITPKEEVVEKGFEEEPDQFPVLLISFGIGLILIFFYITLKGNILKN